MNVGHSDSSRGRSRSRSFAEGTSPTADETIQTKNPVNTRYPGDLTITTSFNYDDKKTDNSYSDSVLDHNDRDSHKKNIPTILDTDLTMVEISDMRIAEELMCNRHLRPPLPIGIPKGKFFLLYYYNYHYDYYYDYKQLIILIYNRFTTSFRSLLVY